MANLSTIFDDVCRSARPRLHVLRPEGVRCGHLRLAVASSSFDDIVPVSRGVGETRGRAIEGWPR